MGEILAMDGRPFRKQEKPVTKSQAGAIITSELDIAIERWNEEALKATNGNKEEAHIFKISFERYAYSKEAAEKANAFGYAKLSITVSHQGRVTEIYNNGRNFVKESALDNTNGYYPDLIVDCMAFLLASGLLYNLAINNPNNKVHEPRAATKIKVDKPRTTTKS